MIASQDRTNILQLTFYTAAAMWKDVEMTCKTIARQMSRPYAICNRLFSSDFPYKCTQTAQEMSWTLVSRSGHRGRDRCVKHYDLFTIWTGNAKLQHSVANSWVTFLKKTDKTRLTKQRPYWKLRVMITRLKTLVRPTEKGPLHDIKFGVWCVCSTRIIGPISFPGTRFWISHINISWKFKYWEEGIRALRPRPSKRPYCQELNSQITNF